jgi:hypothetical protein
MYVYRFDQPMSRSDAQAASALCEMVLEPSDITIYGCLNVADARRHRDQEKWTEGK